MLSEPVPCSCRARCRQCCLTEVTSVLKSDEYNRRSKHCVPIHAMTHKMVRVFSSWRMLSKET